MTYFRNEPKDSQHGLYPSLYGIRFVGILPTKGFLICFVVQLNEVLWQFSCD